MKHKLVRIAVVIGVLVAAALGASVVTAGTQSRQLPEYVGSQACLGCHADQYVNWEGTLHATSFMELIGPQDFPGDPATAPPELKAELEKADFMWHDRRFLAQDPATGELKYLNVGWDAAKQVYVPYKGGGVWSQNCGGCHSGSVNAGVVKTQVESGIGCESCHGPGRDHILGKGRLSLISDAVNPSESCAQCHSGYNQIAGSARWAQGYRPGIALEEFSGFQAKEYASTDAPPFLNDDNHLQQYPQWKASAHAGATQLLIDRGPTYLARQECIACHSTSAGRLIEKGMTYDPAKHLVNDGVGCASCHASHGSEHTASLKMEPQALCLSCHSVGRGDPSVTQIGTTRAPHSPQGDMLQGISAIGVAPTKGPHSEVTCVQCHMSEGNHMMKVITPAAAMATEGRVDTCTACHTNSSAESRDLYLTMWQENVTGRLERIKADVAVIDAALKADPNVLGTRKAAYENARANFWYVQKDNSKGAHNFEYALKILSQAQSEISNIKAALPK